MTQPQAPANTPTALQSVVLVICDVLQGLSTADQARALEAVRVTLGIPQPDIPFRNVGPTAPRPQLPPALTTNGLPMVQVRMTNDRPVVVNPAAAPSPGKRGARNRRNGRSKA
jgi:hypothetical protein